MHDIATEYIHSMTEKKIKNANKLLNIHIKEYV